MSTKPRDFIWKAYLPVASSQKPPRILKADYQWFLTRGITPKNLRAAIAVLRRIRTDVLPLIRRLQVVHGLIGFSLLIHASPNSKKAHIDLTLMFEKRVNVRRLFSAEWCHVKPAPPTTNIAGIQQDALRHGVMTAALLLSQQSDWYLRLIESHTDTTNDIDVLKNVGQFLHFYANISQLVIT